MKYARKTEYWTPDWEQPVVINVGGYTPDPQGGNQSIAADSAGNAYVSWTSCQDGHIRVSKIRDNTVLSTVQVSTTTGVDTGYDQSVAVDPAGNVHVAWRGNDSGIYFSKSTDGGATFSAPVRVNGSGSVNGQAMQSLAVYDANTIYIAWGWDDSSTEDA